MLATRNVLTFTGFIEYFSLNCDNTHLFSHLDAQTLLNIFVTIDRYCMDLMKNGSTKLLQIEKQYPKMNASISQLSVRNIDILFNLCLVPGKPQIPFCILSKDKFTNKPILPKHM